MPKTKLIIHIFFFFFIFPFYSITFANTEFPLEDKVFDTQIKTVQLYPQGNIQTNALLSPVLPLAQTTPLVLEFDDLREDYQEYYVKIIHCSADWSKSKLLDMDFLNQYNEFTITQYELSATSRQPYVHYLFEIPTVKIPGNYIVKVYSDYDESKIALTRRFMIYDSKITIQATPTRSNGIQERRIHQRIQMQVMYGAINTQIPANEITVGIRQNMRWDNYKKRLKPTFINDAEKKLDFNSFDLKDEFAGGNEYRFFDLRTIQAASQNVSHIERKENTVDALLARDKTRGNNAYSQYNDHDGQFIIANLDQPDGHITGEYVKTHFYLQSDKIPQDIYVIGSFTDYQFQEPYKMEYEPEINGYLASVLLKQGWYNFLYYVPTHTNPYVFEGSHFETNNQYEVFVYYYDYNLRTERLGGYLIFSFNGNQ